MRRTDIDTLFDFNYWCNREILAAAAAASQAQFLAPSVFTYRGLRATLVHTLDVEWSWRIRIRGQRRDLWESSLRDEEFSGVAAIAARWDEDEREMREWLATLTDDALSAVVDLENDDRFPLWYYLVHIITHSEQQRRDVAIILHSQAHAVPDLEFLYFADTLGK